MTVGEILSGHQDNPGRTTEVVLRPHYETATAQLRVGARGLTALAEEAVLHWFRVRKLSPGVVYGRYGLEMSVIDCSSLLFGTVTVDDEVTARVQPVGPRYFNVSLTVHRDGTSQVVLRTRVTLVMVRRPGAFADPPAELTGMAVDKIDRIRTAVATHDPEFEARDLDDRLTADALGWYKSWRVPATTCHFSGRMQYSGHMRVLDELAELFLAERGLPARELVATHGLITIMPRVRLRVLADAYAGDLMHTTYKVHQVVGDNLLDCRTDFHVQRGDRRIPVATGILLQGFTRADDATGAVADIDQDIIKTVAADQRPDDPDR